MLKVWSKIIRDRAGNVCIICGSKSHLNAHHLLAKVRYKKYIAELMNGVCICSVCHKWGGKSCEHNAIWFAEQIKKVSPEQYQWVLEHSNDLGGDVDYQTELDRLNALL